MDKKLKTRLLGFSRKDTLNYIESYQAECYEKITELSALLSAKEEEQMTLMTEWEELSMELEEL